MQYRIDRKENVSVIGASIILADPCGVLLGLRRSEHFASLEKNPNRTTLLCFRNLPGDSWDLSVCSRGYDLFNFISKLSTSEIIRIRLPYMKHKRYRVA